MWLSTWACIGKVEILCVCVCVCVCVCHRTNPFEVYGDKAPGVAT